MDVKEWMEVEHAATQRLKQRNYKQEYIRTKTFWKTTKAGSSYSDESSKKEQKEEKG